jgi:rod shape-determining protein MreC
VALGTLDRTPPPFFRQGTSALTKVTVFSALAVFLMVADGRFRFAQPLRAGIATVLFPLERTLLVPIDAWASSGRYLSGLRASVEREQAAEKALAAQGERASRVERLEAENVRLRALLDLKPALAVRAQPAELLYEASDPYSRKVVIDRGTAGGVALGSPVVNEAGVLGQVTRVFLQSSEVTLLTDKDAAIPVLNGRTGARSAVFGATTAGVLEMRFMAGNADVQVGDLLTTSGVDGVYPPGLAVATVASVDRRQDGGFARILLAPAAKADNVRHVLVLEPIGLQLPPRPDEAAAAASAAASATAAKRASRGPGGAARPGTAGASSP